MKSYHTSNKVKIRLGDNMMLEDLEIVTVLRPFDDDELLQQFLQYDIELYKTCYPLEEIHPRDFRERNLTRDYPEGHVFEIIAKLDGKIVGSGIVNQKKKAENYSNHAHLTLNVLPDYRNKGVARKIVHTMVEISDKYNIEAYGLNVTEQSIFEDTLKTCTKWLERMGAKKGLKEKYSRLNIDDLDQVFLSDWRKELKSKLENIRLEFYKLKDYSRKILEEDDFAEEMVDFFNEVHNLIPLGETLREDVKITLASIRRDQENQKGNGWTNDTFFAWDLNTGKCVGSSQIYYPEFDGAEQAYTGFTGVRKEYWGQKIASYLKVNMALYLLETGFNYLDTTNAEENEAILRINQKLGFRVVKTWHWFEGYFDDIKKYYQIQ